MAGKVEGKVVFIAGIALGQGRADARMAETFEFEEYRQGPLGVKASGVGREMGPERLNAYIEPQSVLLPPAR